MGQLIVRDLDDWVVERLKVRAAQHGRSAGAEHRAILKQVLGPRQSLKELLAAMPDVGRDEDFERQQDLGRQVQL